MLSIPQGFPGNGMEFCADYLGNQLSPNGYPYSALVYPYGIQHNIRTILIRIHMVSNTYPQSYPQAYLPPRHMLRGYYTNFHYSAQLYTILYYRTFPLYFHL